MCQPAMHIVLVGENSSFLVLPGRLAKSEKSGISNKNVGDITYLDLGGIKGCSRFCLH